MTGHQAGLFSGGTAFGVGKPKLKGGEFPGLGEVSLLGQRVSTDARVFHSRGVADGASVGRRVPR